MDDTAKAPFQYCARCLEPNSRPGSMFDAEGICLPCRYTEQLDSIDWGLRRRELENIAEWGRQHRSFGYDCIIGVSGGKDSMRIAHYVRDELGLKPLLVCCSYPPEQISERGAANLDTLIAHGFDTHVVSPGPRTWKKLMRKGLREHANIFKSTELALYSSVFRVAVAYNIRLGFFGENPALAFGGSVGSIDGNANNLRQGNTLGGGDVATWIDAGTPLEQLFWYRMPNEEDVDRAGLRIVYIGYYMRDFNELVNGAFAVDHGLACREGPDADPARTGSLNVFEALDEDFVHVNQHLKALKLGTGKITQQASVLVRYGEATRDEALRLVEQYDGKCARDYIERLCDYLQIRVEEFDAIANDARNKDLWQINNHGDWELRYKVRSVTE
ncbi:MAG: LPS biosynthesis protein [Alphaproteobacteria bacterium]|nr:LPS biosynthesis protein [Alphaproteobacteria bacterium]